MTTVNCMSTILNGNSFLYVIGTDSKLQCFGGANILLAEHVVITSQGLRTLARGRLKGTPGKAK